MQTIRDVIQAYIEGHSRINGNDKTDTNNSKQILRLIGGEGADEIDQTQIDEYTKVRSKTVKSATIRRELTVLQAALNWAVRHGEIGDGRQYSFNKPPSSPPKVLWLKEDEEKKLIKQLPEASTSVQLFTLMGLDYGVRSGAMMDLEFHQIDTVIGSIDFNRPNARTTRKRRPVAPITDRISDLLRKRRQETNANRVLNPQTRFHFSKFVKENGFDWVTPHVLKHTAVTLMLRAGVSVQDVSDLTATDERTLRTVYRHFLVQDLRAVAGARKDTL